MISMSLQNYKVNLQCPCTISLSGFDGSERREGGVYSNPDRWDFQEGYTMKIAWPPDYKISNISSCIILGFWKKGKSRIFFATDNCRTGRRRLVFLLLSGPSGITFTSCQFPPATRALRVLREGFLSLLSLVVCCVCCVQVAKNHLISS